MAQSLHLLNSQEIQSKLTRVGERPSRWPRTNATPATAKSTSFFLGALGRYPTETQTRHLALADIERNAKNKRNAYENIIWARD